ncbi:hypothetical protein AWU65_07430 [Paenibacillus glucanolyticus]|uniref:Uncharacterized protein n=1 Tax=Paenibacillus glucanolyticus TaxID=59843 RepID=A0A163I215_9BACL|nr:hypothetical protein AWU65_07430 [Paenibacillus glucanolyticus]
MLHDKVILENNIIMNNIIMVKNKFINEKIVFDNGNKYLGTYIFLISEAFPLIDRIDVFVDSEKKSNISFPVKRNSV